MSTASSSRVKKAPTPPLEVKVGDIVCGRVQSKRLFTRGYWAFFKVISASKSGYRIEMLQNASTVLSKDGCEETMVVKPDFGKWQGESWIWTINRQGKVTGKEAIHRVCTVKLWNPEETYTDVVDTSV